MNYDGRMVTPDKRKGRVRLLMLDDLLHFHWIDRSNGNLVVLPSTRVGELYGEELEVYGERVASFFRSCSM